MTNKISNELDIEGNVQSEGDLNIGNTIEKQIIIKQGASEQQLRQIIRTEIELALKQNQILAEDRAREKLSNFSDKVLPKLVKAEMLDAFSDPTIQMFYRTAQQTAISSERDIDYDVLSELLVYRINNKGDIAKKASITRAAEIIDKISDDTLLGITIHYCINISPINSNITKGLRALENLYKNILNGSELPKDNNWIDNAEILGVIRIESLTSMLKFEDILFNGITGYFSKGIEKNSQQYNDAITKIKAFNISENILVSHELNPNHVRLDIADEKSIESMKFLRFQNTTEGLKMSFENFTEEQKKVVREIFESYKKDKSSEVKIKEEFVKKIKNEYPALNTVMYWWNSNLKPAMNINSIGRVIAHTNAKRLYDNVPDMV